MRMGRAAIFAAVLTGLAASPAFADLTGFIGATTTPANRAAKGFAIGAGLLVVAAEFEYAITPDDPSAGAPSLKTGSGNLLLQTPFAIMGFQPYITGGIGLYDETFGGDGNTGFSANTG